MLRANGLYPTGRSSETALWAYDRGADTFRLLLAVQAPEVKIVSDGPLSGIVITAQWKWSPKESRWDDHRRQITVYRLKGTSSELTYKKSLEYLTAKKYGAEDTMTVDAELPTIGSRLSRSANDNN